MSQEVLCKAIDRDRDKEKFYIFTDTEFECEFINGKLMIPEGVRNLAGFRADESFSKVESMVFPASLESIESLSLFPNERYKNGSVDINVNKVEMAGDERAVRISNSTFKEYQKLYQNGMLIVGRVLLDCNKFQDVITIPDGIEIMNAGCFSHRDIKEISLPQSMKTIGGSEFMGCKNLSKVSFRCGSNLESISNASFAFCNKLADFSVPDSVKEIGALAFKNTTVDSSDLRNVVSIGKDAFYGERCFEKFKFSDSLISEYGGEAAFKRHIGIPDENGFLIRDGSLILAYYDSSKLIIPEAVTSIDENFELLRGNTNSNNVTVILPDTLQEIKGTSALMKNNVSIELPGSYLRQKKSLPADVVNKYLNSVSTDQLSLEDYTSLFLLQNIKKIDPICIPYLMRDCTETIDCMIGVLKDRGTQKGYNATKSFIVDNKEQISSDRILAFYTLCEKNKKKKITEELDRVFGGVKGKAPDIDPTEDECRKKYNEDFIEQILKKATISTNKAFKKAPVLYKNNGEKVPEYVVKTVLALYMEPMIIKGEPKIVPEADELVELFDRKSLNAFLKIVGERVFKKFTEEDYHFGIYGVQNYDLMIPMLCKFMEESTVEACIDRYHKNVQYISNYHDWDYEKEKRNTDAYDDMLVSGIIMSDANAAIEFCKSIGIIDRYAVFRGKAAVEFSGDDASTKIVSDRALKISKAIVIYDEYIKKMDKLMDGYYNDPTVTRCYGIGSISSNNILAKTFFEMLYGRYKSLDADADYYYDYTYKPYELYQLWMNNNTVYEGQVGLCYTIGLAVAYYMFESSDIEAEIMYCRDKWEYRGDYSSATRAVLHIEPETENWKVYNQKGFPVVDM